MRLHWNCTDKEEFNNQADLIIDRFKSKGYKDPPLQEIKYKVQNMERVDLLKDKTQKRNDHAMIFLTIYNSNYKDFEKVVCKHWHVLLRGNTLPNGTKLEGYAGT